jgi:hypothetical protein
MNGGQAQGQVVEASSTTEPGEFVVVNLDPPPQPQPSKYGSLSDDVELGPIRPNASKDDAAEGETVCRVCHLGLSSGNSESIVLGCACKQDLSRSHKDCAEEWFKIRGNTVCEICGETAKNVQIVDLPATVERVDGGASGLQQQVRGGGSATTTTMNRLRYLWANQLIRNCLLATMIIVFMVPWFFRIAYF